MTHRPSSRERYRTFVDDYRHRRLGDGESKTASEQPAASSATLVGGKRREYLREYLRWLWPHRFAVGRGLRARADRAPGWRWSSRCSCGSSSTACC